MHTYARIIHHVSKYNLFVLQIKSIFYEWIIDVTIHVKYMYMYIHVCMHVGTDLEIMENTCICIYNTTRAHIIEFLLNVTLTP